MEHLSQTGASTNSGSGTPGTDMCGIHPGLPDIPEPGMPGTETPDAEKPVPDAPGTESPGSVVPVPDITTSVIAGVVILFFVLLISTMYTVAPMLTGTGQNSGIQNVAAAGSDISDDSQSIPITKATVTPVIISSTPVTTPVIISPTPVTAPVPTPAAPKSYITIEAVPVASPPILQDLTQDLPVPSTKDYFTVYSMNNQETVTTLPYVSFTLLNPPLVIEYDVTPFNISEVKEVDYKILSTVYHEKLTLNRPYEQSWFRVVARDRDTGKVVAETGYGIQYSQETHGKIVVYKGGNYRFEFSGQYSRVSLTMKVKKEGNIESG